jgi:bleomycin hydrolase
MKRLIKLSFSGILVLTFSLQLSAQAPKDSISEKFVFTKVIDLPATSVKDQSASGTCWSYATTSFIESELLRTTKDTFDLSEMFSVRKAYEAKAKNYVRLHGKANFGEGGQAHDVINVIRENGLMTQAAYSGLANGQTKPTHAEMDALLNAMVDVFVKNPAGKLSMPFQSYSMYTLAKCRLLLVRIIQPRLSLQKK